MAICPGSFDPVTLGHVDVIRRARSFAKQVYVVIGSNSDKNHLFDLDTRTALVEDALSDLDGVEVIHTDGLLVNIATELGADMIIKGVRSGTDLDHEFPQAWANVQLAGIETLLLPTAPELRDISSSLVRELARHDALIPGLVTPAVGAALARIRIQRDNMEEK